MNINTELEKFNNCENYKEKDVERFGRYCKLIASYSRFDAKIIGNVLAELISVFEGRTYVYQEANYNIKQAQRLAFDCEETNEQNFIKLIVAEEYKANSYSDDNNDHNNPNLLVQNGMALILANESHSWKTNITFYYANTFKPNLETKVKFEKFSYVKEFIDSLISFKVENEMQRIPKSTLIQLEREFISSRLEQIEAHYSLLQKQQEEQMKRQLEMNRENRQILLKKVLEKK